MDEKRNKLKAYFKQAQSPDTRTRVAGLAGAAKLLLEWWPEFDRAGALAADPPLRIRKAAAAYQLCVRASTIGEQEASAWACLRLVYRHLESVGRGGVLPPLPETPAAPKEQKPKKAAVTSKMRKFAASIQHLYQLPVSYEEGAGARANGLSLIYSPEYVEALSEGQVEVPLQELKLAAKAVGGIDEVAIEWLATFVSRLVVVLASNSGGVGSRGKTARLLALLRERAGQELKLSDLREEVDSVSVYQMLRRLSVKGLVSGQWRIEFPRRGFVVYRPGF